MNRPRAVRLAERFGARLTLLAVALLLVAVPFAFLVFAIRHVGPIGRLDLRIADALHRPARHSAAWVSFLRVLSFLGSALWLWVLVGAAAAYCAVRNRYRLALFLALTCGLGGLLDTALKAVVNRARPVFPDPVAHARGLSFPSGHAMGSIIAYGALTLVFLPAVPRRGRPWLVASAGLVVVLVGFSRIALGVHFLTDVLGGWLVGAAWLAASVAAFGLWRVERGRRPAPDPMRQGVEPEAGHDLRPDTQAADAGRH